MRQTEYYDSLILEDLDIIRTIGTGTFGRVVLVQERLSGDYGALKVISLSDAVRLKQVDHVKNEKNILRSIDHPFIINLKWHDKDEYNVYMLFDYIAGGELFSYLRKAGHFSSSTSSFYAAEIVSALEYLHSKSIVFRDLKPENLLLDKEGHLKLTDFGFAKKLSERYSGLTWTLCGTPEYIAPEVIQSKGHNKAVDWWALGVLIFEMHCGYAPFYHDNSCSTYEKILSGKIEWPKMIDPVVKDIVRKLLVVDRAKRLGNMKNGAEDVKKHRWFRDYSWEDVSHRKLKPPIIPRVAFDGDTRNFAEYADQQSWTLKRISEQDQELFSDF
ncbi:unnamed protein product [Allacma fusca]|uniref:Uncharacterized protein n=1 Tax=Allacma fusca TaxID=39272 RepID=A0A8J2KIA8_9HEXA|nr:unnamed protein product [Allacma fusca]